MNTGNKPATPPAALPANLLAYASWLLANSATLEAWGLVGAHLAHVEVVSTHGRQRLDLDSGHWFLVRVAGLGADAEGPGEEVGIVRLERIVGKGQDAGA